MFSFFLGCSLLSVYNCCFNKYPSARPHYRKKPTYHSSELSVGETRAGDRNFSPVPMEAPAMLVPSLVHSRSVREAIQEVKMVQVYFVLWCICLLFSSRQNKPIFYATVNNMYLQKHLISVSVKVAYCYLWESKAIDSMSLLSSSSFFSIWTMNERVRKA